MVHIFDYVFLAGPDLDIVSRLIDETGRDVTAFDVPGELCVRGPTVIRGYFNNPRANAESFDAEGYFKTGDVLYCDGKSKKWYIVDRKKASIDPAPSTIATSWLTNAPTQELIKVRGFQVSPSELEAVLLSHQNVVDCAVLGLKPAGSPAHADELIRAYVVRRPGTQLTEEEAKQYLKQRLASYKSLTAGVVFMDEIPKSPSGKILKRLLKEQAEKELRARL
jgi:4-coumarate--CoA ligase